MAATILVTIRAGGEAVVEIAAPGQADDEHTTTDAGHAADEGHAAEEPSNPILPATNELFWGALMFCLLWALMKYVFAPPVVKVMQERDAKARTDLEAGDTARQQATLAVGEYEASLASARAEAGRIIEDARTRADAQRRELLAAAEAEVAAMRQAAAAEVAAAKSAAMAELRNGVASIAVSAAEAVVAKRLDEAAQLRVIEDYVNRAGSAN